MAKPLLPKNSIATLCNTASLTLLFGVKSAYLSNKPILAMRIYYYFIATLLLISSCATLPKQYQSKDEIIATGPGPEDMVVDTLSEQPRIIISCGARRKTEPYYGEINIYYPSTGEMKILKRTGEPKGFQFYPHGIDLVQVKDTLVLLVVNNIPGKTAEQSIIRYWVKKDELIFLTKIADPLITSPNAVAGFKDGTILISNDARKKDHFVEAFFMLKQGQIAYWNGNKCSVAAEKFCYANGITINAPHVYLASTRQNKVWQFDFKEGKMINRRVVAKVNGPDNLRLDGDNLLVARHLRFLDFLKHMKDPNHYSPTTAYSIHLPTKKRNVIYFDNGAQLSAGSTALRYKNWLYLSGVFDAKMVRKKISP